MRDACARILGEPVKLTGASRTDAGVHALRQVASLATAASLDPARLARGLNALLPDAIRVLRASEAPGRIRRQALGPGEALPLPDRPGPGRASAACAATPGTRASPSTSGRCGARLERSGASTTFPPSAPRPAAGARPPARCARRASVERGDEHRHCRCPPTASSITWCATSWAAWSRSGGGPSRLPGWPTSWRDATAPGPAPPLRPRGSCW